MGDRVTPAQQRAEWLEYKQIFDDLLARLGAQLARQAKSEKKRLAAQLDSVLPDMADAQPASRSASGLASHKAELRRKAAGLRGLPSGPIVHHAVGADVIPLPPPHEDPP